MFKEAILELELKFIELAEEALEFELEKKDSFSSLSSSTGVAASVGGGTGHHPKTHKLKYEVLDPEDDHREHEDGESEETVEEFEDEDILLREEDMEERERTP